MKPIVSNGRIGMVLLLGTETMLFATFIGAYMVIRQAATAWPPLGVPALVPTLSAVNTALLVLSSILVWRRYFTATWACGALFLGLQGLEFYRLYAQGLTLQTGIFGGFFYALITCHGLHVIGGLVLLGGALRKTSWRDNAELYWHFVTAVWLILFGMLYFY